MAREAVDKHLKVAGANDRPKNGFKQKPRRYRRSSLLRGMVSPAVLRGLGPLDVTAESTLAPIAFVERSAAQLAREGFTRWRSTSQDGAQAGFLFRTVASHGAVRDEALRFSQCQKASPRPAVPMRIRRLPWLISSAATLAARSAPFRDLWRNDDDRKERLHRTVMDGEFQLAEEGRLDVVSPRLVQDPLS